MRILLNLISIKSGGGQQVAFNFIKQISSLDKEELEYYVLVTENTKIHEYCVQKGLEEKLLVIGNNLFERLIFTEFKIKKTVKELSIDLIYTLFGISINNTNAISVVGNAYSNLFFPEIKFWNEKKIIKKVFFTLRDRSRLRSSLNADGIVFENRSMQDRCISLYNYPRERTKFIKPSITEQKDHQFSLSIIDKLNQLPESDFKLLILSGYHKNKNIEILPKVAEFFKNQSINGIKFVISIDKNDSSVNHIINDIVYRKVEDYFSWIGSVNTLDVPLVYQKVNGVILISLLESFSNNIIEAWAYRKVLLITDMEWARSICKNAAVYVDRNSDKDIAEKITKLKNSQQFYDEIINSGSEELLSYPSPGRKVIEQINFLEYLNNLKS